MSAGDLLLEGAGTNLLLQSEDFSTTWTLNAATIGSTITAPDGTNTAQKIEEDNTTAEHLVGQPSSGGATTSAVCFSVFAKAAERTKIRIAFSGLANWNGGGGAAVIFDLASGTATTNNSTPTAFGIVPYPNGWYRCFIVGTPSISLTPNVALFLYTTSSNYAGTTGSGAYIWGAQLEESSYPTSYIQTTGSTATRAADVSTSAATFGNSWYEQSEGTFFVRTQAQNDSVIIVADDGGFSNRKPQLAVGAASAMETAYVASNSVVASLSNSNTANTVFNGAVVYKVDDYAAVINGGTVISDTAGALPSNCTALRIGAFFNGGNPMDGTLRRLTYWPTRLSDDTLKTITA